MSAHIDEKQVVRYEVYCDECDYLIETSDYIEARARRFEHDERHHSEAAH